MSSSFPAQQMQYPYEGSLTLVRVGNPPYPTSPLLLFNCVPRRHNSSFFDCSLHCCDFPFLHYPLPPPPHLTKSIPYLHKPPFPHTDNLPLFIHERLEPRDFCIAHYGTHPFNSSVLRWSPFSRDLSVVL